MTLQINLVENVTNFIEHLFLWFNFKFYHHSYAFKFRTVHC